MHICLIDTYLNIQTNVSTNVRTSFSFSPHLNLFTLATTSTVVSRYDKTSVTKALSTHYTFYLLQLFLNIYQHKFKNKFTFLPIDVFFIPDYTFKKIYIS